MKLWLATATKQLPPLMERLQAEPEIFGSAQLTLISDRPTCDEWAEKHRVLGYRVVIRRVRGNKPRG